VQRGVVALTKSDLADDSMIGLAQLEVEEYLRGSFLESAPIVPVSARTGAGVLELKKALHEAAARVSAKDATRTFRLPIDRSFAMKGFGTVVTGTLLSGSVGAGDEVELFPCLARLRVRGVQTGGQTVERAFAGQRTAVNLAGISHQDVRRGMCLAAPGKFRTTRRIDAEFTLLPDGHKLKNRERVHFHAAAMETIAEVLLYGKTETGAGSVSLAHLRLQDEVLVLAGDRFIVRQFSPVRTIGGGVVLDPLARRPLLRDTGRVEFLETLQAGKHGAILQAMVERASMGLRYEEILARTGWEENDVRRDLDGLAKNGTVKVIPGDSPLLVDGKTFDKVRTTIFEIVERFQRENPLLPGIAREDLRAKLGRRVRTETFRAALADLAAEKRLEILGETVKRAGSGIELQADEKEAKDKIEAAFRTAALTVPTVKDVLAGLTVEAKRADKLLHILLREKVLVRITPELIYHRAALAHLKEQLLTYKKGRGERISVPGFKDLTGISRKYAIPLLEYLDRERVTRRMGDERVIL
nr:SelB C-terminal domain-containing protein [Acidobacteriota bacterium]